MKKRAPIPSAIVAPREGRGPSQAWALSAALDEIRGAREDWDQVLEGLSGQPVAKLLRGHGLPDRLDQAVALLQEVIRTDEHGRRPGRPPGEGGKVTPRLEARKAELKKDYDAGMPYVPDMEEKYGTSHVTLRTFVKRQDWPRRDRRKGPAPAPTKKPPAKKKAGKRR